jgi:hypothetical protein
MRTQQDTKLADEVRHILLGAWDPIGVQELPVEIRDANLDEYDCYVGPIVRMIMDHQDEAAFRDYLHNVESRNMGLKPQFSRASDAAKALVQLTKAPQGQEHARG